ncbi:MAG TPA: methyltransferase [Gemmatimonadales bacterium]|nr:methyltransferase [Gemmatimonadales bacterium]
MEQPPPLVIRDMITAHVVSRCLHIVAEAGVADALDDRPATAAELARATGLDADALNRMMRLLAASGVFAKEGDGWTHTPPSRFLRSDHPDSMRSFARMIGMPVVWNQFTELGSAAKTGKPALSWAGLVSYYSGHPHEARLFNEAMVAKSRGIIPAVIEAYDFRQFGTIADVGGGHGHLLQAILTAAPGARGILFDLPHVIAEAKASASDRLALQPGDFFKSPLPVVNAYVLMEVIHDWADDDAIRILSAVRRAAPPSAKVLLVEALIADDGEHFPKVLDVVMLAVTGGRERSAAEYGALLSAAGLRLERVIPTHSQCAVLEAVPA